MTTQWHSLPPFRQRPKLLGTILGQLRSRIEPMDEPAYFLTTLGAAATAPAIGCAIHGPWFAATSLFLVALLLLVSGSGLFFWSAKRAAGIVVLAAAVLLFTLSWLPWHRHPGEAGTGYHRHNVWQMRHVH
jgi:hypothetical protein